MKGYITGGDWADITSIHRNDIVFEGRHKAYGAYQIRRRYGNSLLFALLSAIAFMTVCAVTPYIIQRFFNHDTPLENPKPDETATIIPFTVDPPKKKMDDMIKPPVTPPPSKDHPPIIDRNHHIDTSDTKKPEPIVPIEPKGGGTISSGVNNQPISTGGSAGGSGTSSAPPLPPVETPIPTMVSEMPKFPNGTVSDYLRNNIVYPPLETDLKIEGTVYVYFVIETDGSVSNVKILKGVDEGVGLENEARRVISQMPKWIPGKQNGHPTRVQFSLPIRFQLR